MWCITSGFFRKKKTVAEEVLEIAVSEPISAEEPTETWDLPHTEIGCENDESPIVSEMVDIANTMGETLKCLLEDVRKFNKEQKKISRIMARRARKNRKKKK